MTGWADDLREAGLDPVRDWREWNKIRLTLEAWRGEIDTAELIRLSRALGAASKLTDFEHAYLPYIDIGRADGMYKGKSAATGEQASERMRERFDFTSRKARKNEWNLPNNTPASDRQSEEPCPNCGGPTALHRDLKMAQTSPSEIMILGEAQFDAHLTKLAEKKARHTAANQPTYICRRCDSPERGMF